MDRRTVDWELDFDLLTVNSGLSTLVCQLSELWAKGTARSECDAEIKDEYDCGNSNKSRSQSPPALQRCFFYYCHVTNTIHYLKK